MTRTTTALATLCAAFLAPAIALAGPAPEPADAPEPAAAPADAPAPVAVSVHVPEHLVGLRVGGYGFRSTEPGAEGEWNDCEMDGSGIFAQRTLSRRFYAEAALDFYHAKSETIAPGAMDRASTIASVAGGIRLLPERRFSPYLQVGTGVELTKASIIGADARTSGVFPMGFFGFGLDVDVARGFGLGLAVRTNVMAHFPHGEMTVPGSDETTHTLDDPDFELAAQGQLSATYTF
jgi:hypothetical protein